MASNAVHLPNIPDVPKVDTQAEYEFLRSIKESLEIMTGKVGGNSTLTSLMQNVSVVYDRTATIVATGGLTAIGFDPTTGERGFLVNVTNRTGAKSVKGTLVSASTVYPESVVVQATEYDTVGVVQEKDIADGSGMWIWVNGSMCRVLYKNAAASTMGNILIAADTDGRAIDVANPGSGLPAAEVHFKECGHVMETKAAGTDVLVLAHIHFN